MSIMYCETHNRHYDLDFYERCPECEEDYTPEQEAQWEEDLRLEREERFNSAEFQYMKAREG